MATKLVIQQPQPVKSAIESDQWSTGICDCCEDLGECCCGFWCFPCYACKTARDFGECLCLPLLDAFNGVIPAVSLSMRVAVRERYGIKGSICKDCLYSSFCICCSWCQIAREMKARTQNVTLINAKPVSLVTSHLA
ncbi:PL8L1 protein, partial [Atractosteus spatula]|nr:PL8L1 protein [Atractosteus spatula]